MKDEHMAAHGADQAPASIRETGAFSKASALPMKPCEIRPGWVRSGQPVTHYSEHSTAADELAWTSVWDCTQGTFEWHYALDEIVYILEGETRVTDAHGRTHTLRAGSIGYFPAHTTWYWEVDQYVRKVAICRREVPFGLRLATRVLARINLDGRLLRRLRAKGRVTGAITRKRAAALMLMLAAAVGAIAAN